MGCNAGLFRYDGNRFKQYLNSEMSGRALSNLEIGPNGNVWCGSFTGQIFHVENDSLMLFADWSDKERQFPDFRVVSNAVWITSDDGLYELNHDGKQNKIGLSESSFQHTDHVFVSSTGRVVVYSNINGFLSLEHTDGKLERLALPNALEGYKEGRAFIFERNGKILALWQRFSDSKAVWVEILKDRVELIETFSLSNIVFRVNRVSVGREHEIWVSTNAGAFRFSETETRTFFPEQRVSDVMMDREGNHWFTTLDNGIYLMPSLNMQHYGKVFFGESISNITSLAKGPNGGILLGHSDGTVSSFDRTTETFKTILEAKRGIHRSTEKLAFANGNLFASRGLLSLQQNGRSADILQGGNTKDIVPLEGDTLLIATVTELAKLYPSETESWHRETLREGFCRSVAVTDNGTIWAAFKDGVFFGNGKKLEPFLRNDKPVYAAEIAVDDANNLWIATISNGLLKISGAQIVAEFNTSTGLASNDLHRISISNDTVWVTHAQGLDRFVNGEFHHFNLLDGLPLKEVNDMLVADGFVYLASHSGLTVLPTNAVAENQTAPKLIANSILIGNNSVSALENHSFKYDENELKINLSVLAFRSRGTCKVRYRLIGLDTTWTDQAGNRIEIVYNALPPGDFQFEAMALNEDGVPSNETISLGFNIKTPFWQTWWFYMLVGLMLIGLVSVAFSLRIRHIRRKAALEHAVVSSKLTALRSQMNPHFLFNALNSIQELVLSKDTKNAIRYLGTFSGLTRKILENSAKETVRLSEELDMLNHYLELEKLRFGDSLQIHVEVGSEIDTEGIEIPPMLIQPYVENALKHGLLHVQTDRKLNLTLAQKDDILIVEIEDNGVGRAKAEEIAKQKKKHQSFSSEATENRLRSMKNANGTSGSVEVVDLLKDGEAVGTKVVLKIPYLPP